MKTQSNREVIFIDANVADKQTLINNAAGNVKVIELNDETDAIEQISVALSMVKNLDAIHIISHGKTGELQFANGVLNTGNLVNYRSQLQKIGAALSEDGDILLYGWDVASGEEGETFIHSFMVAMWQTAKAKRLSIHWQKLPKLMLSNLMI
jgi:fibronectin-binding autotransporter adhesin